MRLRILLGTAILLLGLAAYGAVVQAIAQHLLPPDPALAFTFYGVAGVAWVAPAALLTRWMQRAPPYRPPPEA